MGTRKRQKATEPTEFVWEVIRGDKQTGYFLQPGDLMWLYPLGKEEPYGEWGRPARVPAEIVECGHSLDDLFKIRVFGATMLAPVSMLEFFDKGPGYLPEWEGPVEGLVLVAGTDDTENGAATEGTNGV